VKHIMLLRTADIIHAWLTSLLLGLLHEARLTTFRSLSHLGLTTEFLMEESCDLVNLLQFLHDGLRLVGARLVHVVGRLVEQVKDILNRLAVLGSMVGFGHAAALVVLIKL